MKISKDYKKMLDSEFDFVIDKMENSKTPDQMLYYFTGIYTMMNRIFNLEFSDDLLFTHSVLENAYKTILERVGAIKAGHDTVMFHEDFGPTLIGYTKKLKKSLYNSKQRLDVLKQMTVLAYKSTGNGFYLSEKKMIDVSPKKKQTKDK